MKYTLIIAIFLFGAFFGSCEDHECLECPIQSTVELEAIVKGNCVTLTGAIEAFTEENDGYYPTSLDSDTTISGKLLIDYLPGGVKLLNPFTGLYDQPIETIPVSPGEIGLTNRQSYMNIYDVQGYGADGIIYEGNSIAETERLVIDACLLFQRALELWHQDNEGSYPSNSNEDNILGKAIVDYFPDGSLLVNPFTMMRTEPAVWGSCAVMSGEIGYSLRIDPGYVITGYTITGVGYETGEIVITLVDD